MMPRFDAHCHTWESWPYDRQLPDADAAARPDGLAAALLENEVAGALVVCADIGGRDNTEMVLAELAARPTWVAAIDVDSRWSSRYHKPGAGDRLERLLTRTRARAVTHYLADVNDGWLETADADRFLETLARHDALLSLHAPPTWHVALAEAASRHPEVRILLHHFGLPVDPDAERGVQRLARRSNIALKASGWYYTSHAATLRDGRELLARLVEAYGPARLAWGSDWPVSRGRATLQESIELVAGSTFLGATARDEILGGTIRRLLRLEGTS
jgi:L-fuconolactonase